MKTIALLLTLLVTSNVMASTYFIKKIEAKDFVEIDNTAKEILIAALEENGEGVREDIADSDYQLTLKLTGIGESVHLFLKKYEDGKLKRSLRAKVRSVDDIDKGIERLVLSMLKGKGVKDGPSKRRRVGKIKDDEMKTLSRRVESRNYEHFAFGPSWIGNMKTSGTGLGIRYGYYFDVHEQMAIKILGSGDLNFSSKAKSSQVYGGLGLTYYFNDTDLSPFIGADFGYGVANGDQVKDVANFGLGVDLGGTLFRTTGKQFGLYFRGQTIFEGNEEGNPMLISLNIGVWY